jgi:hypothetical protein
LLVTTFLTLFLKVFNLQGEEASKLAGNFEEEVTDRVSEFTTSEDYKGR